MINRINVKSWVDEVKKRAEKRAVASGSTVKWPQEIEEALVIERNGWGDSNVPIIWITVSTVQLVEV